VEGEARVSVRVVVGDKKINKKKKRKSKERKSFDQIVSKSGPRSRIGDLLSTTRQTTK